MGWRYVILLVCILYFFFLIYFIRSWIPVWGKESLGLELFYLLTVKYNHVACACTTEYYNIIIHDSAVNSHNSSILLISRSNFLTLWLASDKKVNLMVMKWWWNAIARCHYLTPIFVELFNLICLQNATNRAKLAKYQISS